MMLFKNKSSKNKRFLYLGIVPALLVVGLSTVVFNTSRAKSVVAKVESNIEKTQIPLEEASAVSSTIVAETDANPLLNNQDTIKEGGEELFTETEILPEPKGGMDAFRKWIGKNYIYPQAAIDAGVKGTIRTSFVIEKDGSLSDIKIVEDLGHGTGEAAVNVLKKSPKWLSAIQNGRKVRCEYTLPIRLDLTIMGDDSRSKDTIHSKSGGTIKQIIEGNETFSQVEIQPEPPGGLTAYRKWIGDNFIYPQAAIDAGVKGTILTSFVVEKDGSLSNLKIIRDLSYNTGRSAIQVLKKSPKWSPGIQNGKPVRVEYSFPIRLDLTNSVKSNQDYTRVEIIPESKGGSTAFRKYLASNFEYPKKLFLNKSSGNLEVKFEIDEDGNPTNFKIVKESHNDIAGQVESLIRKYGNWSPAIMDGKKMKFAFTLAINLKYREGVGTIEVDNLKSLGFIKS